MLYDDKKISLIEYTIYKRWFDEFISEVPVSKVIYVKTEPEIAHRRVVIRNRPGEQIPIEYLERCNKYHEDWLLSESYVQFTLDGNIDIYENPNVLENWISDIKLFINPKKIYETIIPEYESLFSPKYDESIYDNSINPKTFNLQTYF